MVRIWNPLQQKKVFLYVTDLNLKSFLLANQRQPTVVGSISAALSCPVYVPPRKETSGEERGLLSRTAAGNRA